MAALALDSAELYVAAAYVLFVALVVVYAVIVTARLTRASNEVEVLSRPAREDDKGTGQVDERNRIVIAGGRHTRARDDERHAKRRIAFRVRPVATGWSDGHYPLSELWSSRKAGARCC